MDPDLALLERWRAGDQQAGQDLFARHLADIYRFFEHKVGADADELVQGTFLACIHARDRFRAQSTFRTYLFAIARHELYAFYRRLPKHEHVDFEQTSIEELASSMGSRLDRARRIDHLKDALRRLPAEQQVLLEMHYWHDLDAAGLAEVFETTPGTMRVRLLRARRALRAAMEQQGPGALAGDDRMSTSLSAAELDVEPADEA